MKPPSTFQWFIGNPIVSLALMLGAIGVGFLWFAGQVTGWAVLLAVIVASLAAKASDRVNAYTAWKREWDGMGGSGGGMRLPTFKGVKFVMGGIVWLLLAAASLDAQDDEPWMQAAALLFWAATAVMAFAMVARLLRGGRQSRRPEAVTVSVCVAQPTRSPAVRDAYEMLDGRNDDTGFISRHDQR